MKKSNKTLKSEISVLEPQLICGLNINQCKE